LLAKIVYKHCIECGRMFIDRWNGKRICCSSKCAADSRVGGRIYAPYKYKKCSGCGIELTKVDKKQRIRARARKGICDNCAETTRLLKLRPTNDKGEFQCRICKEWKAPNKFKKDKARVLGIELMCLDCFNERRKPTYRAWLKKKRKDDPKFRLNQRMSGSIRHCLNGTKNLRHWENLVGYTVEQLKRSLERKFTDGMSWDNYGVYWHIDHYLPLSAFNFEKPEDKDFKLAWALKNLRPLKADENQKKWNKPPVPVQRSIAWR